MKGIGITDKNRTNLDSLLQKTDVNYSVPFFQREYSWTKDDWVDL